MVTIPDRYSVMLSVLRTIKKSTMLVGTLSLTVVEHDIESRSISEGTLCSDTGLEELIHMDASQYIQLSILHKC